MKKKYKALIGTLLVVALIIVTGFYLSRQPIQVLQPAGIIGSKQRDLILFAAALSLAIIIPVFTLLGVFAYKYRETSRKAKYTPELGGSRLAETIWWTVPTVLIVVISFITWHSSYALDPYKPIVSTKPTLRIQVMAMDWKWLFIYPDQHIASVNELALPIDRPVRFDITSDTVMNSFWIPKLGGQMYAMPGMMTQLNLEANKLGTYPGSSANISGKGFADMRFKTKVTTQAGFDSWIQTAKSSKQKLTSSTYAALTKPSSAVKPSYYASVSYGLYDTTMMKYMMPENGAKETN